MSNWSRDINEFMRRTAGAINATEAAAFAIERDFLDEDLVVLVHLRGGDEAGVEPRAAALAAFKEIVRQCLEAGRDGAVEIAGSNGPGGKQYCLVTLARQSDVVVGAAAFVLRCPHSHNAQFVLEGVQRRATGR